LGFRTSSFHNWQIMAKGKSKTVRPVGQYGQLAIFCQNFNEKAAEEVEGANRAVV
jgi:hypothetical protein